MQKICQNGQCEIEIIQTKLRTNNYEQLYHQQYQICQQPSDQVQKDSGQVSQKLIKQNESCEQIKNQKNYYNLQRQSQLVQNQQQNYEQTQKHLQFQQNIFYLQQLNDNNDSNSFPNKSPYKDQYIKKFGQTSKLLDLQLFLNRISSYGIHLQYHLSHPMKFQMKLIGQTRNSKIMTYSIRFSYFFTKIQIFNINRNDDLHPIFQKWINEGAYGAIYEANFCNKKYAVKKIGIGGMQPFQMIKRIVKQYCILKLCGALSIGPKVAPLFGFDIIITGQSAYFSSELGINFYDYLKYLSLQKSQNQLKEEVKKMFSKLEQSLKLLHQLNITHNDIKPNNIVFSPAFNKLVFIDFGLSDSNQLLMGYWKPQLPKGSLNFCCQDMRKLILERSNRKNIDLFYNDMVAMQKTQQAIYQGLQTIHIQITQSLNFTINQNSIQNYQEQKNKHNIKLNDQFSAFDIFLKSNHNICNSNSKLARIQTNKQSQILYCFIFIYLIHKRKQQNIQELCQKDQNVRQILKINLYRIYFIFFQQYSDKRLLKLYQKVKEILKNNTNQQSHFIIINKLNIYFFNNNEESRSLKEKYQISQQKTKKIINLRFNTKDIQKVQKQEQKIKNINFTVNCYQTINSIGKRIIQQMTIQYYQFLQAIRQTQCILLNYNRLIKQEPQIPHNILKTFFRKLGFNIEFNSLQLWQKNICYLKILTVIHMYIVKNYDIKQTMSYFLLEEAENYVYNSQNIKFMNKILDFVYEEIEGENIQQEDIEVQKNVKYPTQQYKNEYSQQLPNKQHQVQSQKHQYSSKSQLFKRQKYLLKKNDKYILSHKQKQKIPIKLLLYQQSLLNLYKITNSMNIVLDYQKIIDYSKIYVQLAKQKLTEYCALEQYLLSHEQSKSKQLKILVSNFYYLDFMVFQNINYLRITLSQTFTKFDNNGDIVPMVESYQILLSIIQLFRKYFQFNKNDTKYKSRNYLKKNEVKIVTLLLRYLYITKTLFSTLIYTSSICQQTYQKYDLIYKYFSIFNKISFQTFQQKEFIQLEVKLISKIIQILAVNNNYEKTIQFLDYLEKQKSINQSYQFLYLKYIFYKNHSNSKCLIQINKKLQKHNNFHQSKNDQKNFQQLKNIHKIVDIFKISHISQENINSQNQFKYKVKLQKEQSQTNLNKIQVSTIIKILNNKIMSCQKQKQMKYTQLDQNQQSYQFKNKYLLQKNQYNFIKQQCKKAWQIIQKMNKNNYSYKLFYFRQIIRKIIVCKLYLNDLLSQLLQKYGHEVQIFIREIYKNLQFLKQNQKILPKKISHFYGYLRNKQEQQRFWSNTKKEFYYNKKVMLLRQVVQIPKSSFYNFSYINILSKQWKGIHDSLIQVFLKQKIEEFSRQQISKGFINHNSNINKSCLIKFLKNSQEKLEQQLKQTQQQKRQFEQNFQNQLIKLMVQHLPIEYFQIKCKYRKLLLSTTKQYIQINHKQKYSQIQQFDQIYQKIYQKNKQKYQQSLIQFLRKLNYLKQDSKTNQNNNLSKCMCDDRINKNTNLNKIDYKNKDTTIHNLIRDFSLQKQQLSQNIQQKMSQKIYPQKQSPRNPLFFFNYFLNQKDSQSLQAYQQLKQYTKTSKVTINQIISFKKYKKSNKYRSNQIFLLMILDCYSKLINCQKFIGFITNQSLSNQISSDKTIQLQLKLIFCETVEFKQLSRMFQLNSIYLNMIKIIIEIDIKKIFRKEKQEKQQYQQSYILDYLQSKSKYKKQQYEYFFVYVLMEVEKYINKYSCSSYSSVLVHLFTYAQNCIKVNLSKNNYQMINLQDRLIILSNLEKHIFNKSFNLIKQSRQNLNNQKYNKKQQSVYDSNIIMLISIQKIKLEQFYKNLINQNKNNIKINQKQQNLKRNEFFTECQNQNDVQQKQKVLLTKQKQQIENQFKDIKKWLFTIFSKIQNLQYVLRSYVLHNIYHYIVKLLDFYNKYNIIQYKVQVKHLPFLIMSIFYQEYQEQQNKQQFQTFKQYFLKYSQIDSQIDQLGMKKHIKNRQSILNMKKLKNFKISMFRSCRRTNQTIINSRSQSQGKQYGTLNQNYYFKQFQMIDQNYLVESILSMMFQFSNNFPSENKNISLHNKVNLKAQQKLNKYLQTIR